MQGQGILRGIMHRVIGNKRRSEWMVTIHCHSQRTGKTTCKEWGGGGWELIDCLQLCSVGFRLLVDLNNALDAEEMRT